MLCCSTFKDLKGFKVNFYTANIGLFFGASARKCRKNKHIVPLCLSAPFLTHVTLRELLNRCSTYFDMEKFYQNSVDMYQNLENTKQQ
jgi:hypothetical protein